MQMESSKQAADASGKPAGKNAMHISVRDIT
jgi:hypothetical protein